jgi:hypothetical protein
MPTELNGAKVMFPRCPFTAWTVPALQACRFARSIMVTALGSSRHLERIKKVSSHSAASTLISMWSGRGSFDTGVDLNNRLGTMIPISMSTQAATDRCQKPCRPGLGDHRLAQRLGHAWAAGPVACTRLLNHRPTGRHLRFTPASTRVPGLGRCTRVEDGSRHSRWHAASTRPTRPRRLPLVV